MRPYRRQVRLAHLLSLHSHNTQPPNINTTTPHHTLTPIVFTPIPQTPHYQPHIHTIKMPSRQLSVTEPHPSVPRSGGYIGGGRGGAGNYQKYKAGELTTGASATGPASLISLSRPSNTKRTVGAGRGGAGNMVTATEQSMFQFDEEMLKTREAPVTPIYRIGRGGAGNMFPEVKAASASSRKNSSSSTESGSERPANLRRESGGMFSSIFSRRSA